MDYGADDPLGIAHQLYLQEVIRNLPNTARVMAATHGQYEGMGLAPMDATGDRNSANLRQAYPLEYLLGRVGGNVVSNPMGAGSTMNYARNLLAGPPK